MLGGGVVGLGASPVVGGMVPDRREWTIRVVARGRIVLVVWLHGPSLGCPPHSPGESPPLL
ncbi:hypothetical protein CZ771_11835 [Actinomycetales bacterium JB111]|nr:hypothetical protein CZ771_11835 [Actinomycetales bacterium JB111]